MWARWATVGLFLMAVGCASRAPEGASRRQQTDAGPVDSGRDAAGHPDPFSTLPRWSAAPPEEGGTEGVGDAGLPTCRDAIDAGCGCARFDVSGLSWLRHLASSASGDVVAATATQARCIPSPALQCACEPTVKIHHVLGCDAPPEVVATGSLDVQLLTASSRGAYFTTTPPACGAPSPGAPALMFAPWDGTGARTVHGGFVGAVGADGDRVYFIEAGGAGSRLVSLPLATTEAEAARVVHADVPGAPHGARLAADGAHVYFVTGAGLRRVSASGGEVEPLLAVDVPVTSLALTADRVVLGGPEGLVSVPKAGGAPTIHSREGVLAFGLVADSKRAVAVFGDGVVAVVAFDGGAPRALARIIHDPFVESFSFPSQLGLLGLTGHELVLPLSFSATPLWSVDLAAR